MQIIPFISSLKAKRSFTLVVVTLMIISLSTSFKDIMKLDRPQDFLSISQIKKMMERVIEDFDQEVDFNYKMFQSSPPPEDAIRHFINISDNKKQINNAIKLLCNAPSNISEFYYPYFIEQFLQMEDKDIIKTTLYKFRELYTVWSLSKAIEMIYSDTEVEIPYICDWYTDIAPSEYFIDNESKIDLVRIRNMSEYDRNDNIDLFKLDRTLASYGFKFIIKEKEKSTSNSNISNEEENKPQNTQFNDLSKDKNLILNKQIEIEVIRAHENFNYNFSSLNFLIRAKLNINTNNKETDLKYLYTEMKIASKIIENLNYISTKVFKGFFTEMFDVSYNLDGVWNQINKNIINDSSINKLNSSIDFFTKYTSKQTVNDYLKQELAYTYPSFFKTKNEAYNRKLHTQILRSTKVVFNNADLIKQIRKQEATRNIIDANDYIHRGNVGNCNPEYQTLLNSVKFSEQDSRNNVKKELFALCYYNKSIEHLAKSISSVLKKKDDSENDLSLKVNLKEYFTNYNNKEFYSNLLQYQFFSRPFYNTVEKLIPSFTNNDFSQIKQCINLSYQEIYLLTISQINKIMIEAKEFFSIFEVYTSTSNTYLNNSKYYLTKYLLNTSKSFKILYMYLDYCKYKNNDTLLDYTYSKYETNYDALDVLDDFSKKLKLYNEMFVLIDNILSLKTLLFSEKITKIRTIFYSMYYEDKVANIFMEDFESTKKVFSDDSKNAMYSIKLEKFFIDILQLIFDVPSKYGEVEKNKANDNKDNKEENEINDVRKENSEDNGGTGKLDL